MAFAAGLAALIVLLLFVFFWFMIRQRLVERALEAATKNPGPQARSIAETMDDVLSGWTEMWSLVGQYLVATFIGALVAILLLADVIQADAGLPILSAVAGLAIGRFLPRGRGRSAGDRG
jgi:predicted PurR-regulated permease PerM